MPLPVMSSPVMPSPALVFDDVTVAFDSSIAVEGVSAVVQPGDSVALIGPNGAGKSTLLRATLGLVPLARGSITVLGTDPVTARRHVAYVPQADQLDREFPVTVIDVVRMGRYRSVGWGRRLRRSDKILAADALERVGLSDRAHDRFGTLSGGQRQRVLLARAICQQARLLLLDEPFNGVDSTTQEALLAVLSELRNDGVAIVMPTHDLAVAHLACGDACLLNRRQVAFGPIEDVLDLDALRDTYSGQQLVGPGDQVIIAAGHHDSNVHHHDH